MAENSQIVNLIALFCQEKEIAESTFGLRAVNDGKFVGRLRAGKEITLSTLKTIEKFFIDNKFEIDKSLTQPQTTSILRRAVTLRPTRRSPIFVFTIIVRSIYYL